MTGAPLPVPVPVRVTALCEGASCSCWVNGAADPLDTFLDFEQKLTRACKKAVHSRSIFTFKQKDLVVVKDSKSYSNDVWLRGEVRCVFGSSKGELYRVFLVDYGRVVSEKSPNIVPCPPEFADYPRQARLVRLFGLFPATIDIELAEEKAPNQLVRTDQWTCKALEYVKSLIAIYDNAYFIPEAQQVPRDFEIFGDLRFQIGKQVIHLSEELVKREYALSCPDDYVKIYMTSAVHLESKLEKNERAVSASQPATPKASPSDGTIKTRQEIYDELRKHTKEVLNESEPTISRSIEKTVAEVPPVDQRRLNAYASRLSESPKSSIQQEFTGVKKAVQSPPSQQVAIIPAGFEIVCESKRTVNPRIQHKAMVSSPSGGLSETAVRNTTDSEKTSSSRAPSRTASESECTPDKTSDVGNTLLRLLRNRSNANSSAENTVTSDDATGRSAPSSGRPPSRRRRNIAEIISRVNSSPESANSSASSGLDVSREAVSPGSAERRNDSVGNPQQATKEATPVFRLERRRESHRESLFDLKDFSRVLVHGAVSSKIWRNLADAKFDPAVKKALQNLKVDDLHPLQQRAWPVIKNRRDVVMVGRKTQGKLLSYVAPVMDFVLDSEKPQGCGPLAIILCPGYNQAHQAYVLCKKVLSSYDKDDVQVLMFHDSTVSVNDTVKCLNGCEVLVTTPRCLVKLVQFSTNLHRLGVLVLDHADILLAKFVTEVKGLMTEVKEQMKRQVEEKEIVQIVISSHKWIPRVKQFCLKFPDNPAVIISCPLEAALYADPQVDLRIVKEREKLKHMLDILETVAGHQKVVVFCSSPEEVDSLYESLKAHSLFVLKTSENFTQEEMEAVKSYWDDSCSPHFYILLCTDAEFLELGIRDATCLIHYSMHPDGTKTMFGARFSCLMANYPSLFKNRIAVPTVFILLDETNDHQLPGVINFMQRLGKGSDDLRQIFEEGMIRREREKKSSPLCLDLQMFGDCWDPRSCEDRHIFLPDVDTSKLPKSGWVKLKILHTISACHFTARIVEHSETGVAFKKWPNEYVSVAMKMAMRFNDPANRMEHVNPKVGDICAVNSDVSLYNRAIIVKVTKEERKSTLCDVRLLDDGLVLRKKAFDLLYLPEELQVIPPQAIDIFVCRLKPKDLDDAWSKNVTETVEEWVNVVKNDLSGRTYFKAKVVLSLSDRIWVDPLEVLRNLQSVGTDVVTRSFRRALLEGGLAEDNSLHVKKLYALCEQCGFHDAIPAITSQPKLPETKKQSIPQWAHLDLNTFELTRFICGENPQLFYVRRVYTNETFDDLMREIQPIGESTAGSETVFRPGRVCLAFCSADKQWARAMMQSTVQNERVFVFFVDYGDTEEVGVKSLAVIPDEIITKLPFQAIECSLVGIKAKGSQWTDKAYEFFEDVCCGADCLYTKPVASSCAQLTAGKHYKIILVDTTGESNIVINDLLVNENIAEPNEEEQNYLINPFDGPIADVNQKLYSRDEPDESVELENPSEEVVQNGTAKEDNPPEIIENHTMINGYTVNFTEFDQEDIVAFLDSWFNLGSNRGQTNGTIENGQSVPALPAPEKARSSHNASAADRKTDVEGTTSAPNQRKHMPALSSARAPQMIWYQDMFTVWVDIFPGAVIDDYCLRWSLNHIQFSACDINGKYYFADLSLAGTIRPEELTHCKQGLTIGIAARKACTGWMWPRLLGNPISPKWLKHDSAKEFLSSDSDSDTPITERLIKRAHKSGMRNTKQQKYDRSNAKFDAALSEEESDPEVLENLMNDDQLYAMRYRYGN